MHKPLFNCLNRQSESLFCWQCSQQNKRKQPTNLAFSQQGIPTNVRHLTLHILYYSVYIYKDFFFCRRGKRLHTACIHSFLRDIPSRRRGLQSRAEHIRFFFMEKKGRKKRNHYTCLRSKKEVSENRKMKKKCRPHPAFIRASRISQTSCKLFLHFYLYVIVKTSLPRDPPSWLRTLAWASWTDSIAYSLSMNGVRKPISTPATTAAAVSRHSSCTRFKH